MTDDSINHFQDFILNIYKTILLRGIKGSYIYVCDKNLREYFSQFIPKFKTKTEKENLILEEKDVIPYVNSIPIYDLKVAAGNFSILIWLVALS